MDSIFTFFRHELTSATITTNMTTTRTRTTTTATAIATTIAKPEQLKSSRTSNSQYYSMTDEQVARHDSR